MAHLGHDGPRSEALPVAGRTPEPGADRVFERASLGAQLAAGPAHRARCALLGWPIRRCAARPGPGPKCPAGGRPCAQPHAGHGAAPAGQSQAGGLGGDAARQCDGRGPRVTGALRGQCHRRVGRRPAPAGAYRCRPSAGQGFGAGQPGRAPGGRPCHAALAAGGADAAHAMVACCSPCLGWAPR